MAIDSAAAAAAISTDVLVVGAGPVGLFQVFELGLHGLHAEVVDALPYIGGQCIELYPDKPIYDIAGLPQVSGRELVERLKQQAAPFRPGFHLGQLVSDFERLADGRFALVTDSGQRFVVQAVVIAAGAGAFLPRSLKLDGLAPLLGRQVFHHAAAATADRVDGRQVVVVGDDDTALQAACDLAEAGRSAAVTLLHRRDQFRAAAPLVARQQALRIAGKLGFIAAQPSALQTHDGRLVALELATADERTLQLPVDTLLVLLGLSPRLGPIASWGLALERRQVRVDSAQFETSEPGVFAVGDINLYPGKRKLLVCGFHEATLAAFGIAARRTPGEPIALQYTTTSTRLHALLGVASDGGPGQAA